VNLARNSRRAAVTISALVPFLVVSHVAVADGLVIDRVYDPYVQPLETEIELRSIIASDDQLPDVQRHSLGLARSLTDRVAIELYLIGTHTRADNLDLDAYELELKWQITEQGEFAFDWGMMFELEREVDSRAWEASAKVLSSRDFGRWTATANFALAYEWGAGVSDEIETEFHLQARHRFKEVLEPAVEFHMGQDVVLLGPLLAGVYRLSPGRKLRWDGGIFWGLDEKSPDRVIKLNIEYEF
jgi:hypothetical protein